MALAVRNAAGKQSRNLRCAIYKGRGERGSECGIADNAERVSAARNSAGEEGIILQHGVDAYHDSAGRGPAPMDLLARGLAGNPAGGAGSAGGFSVQGHRVFHGDQGKAGLHVAKKRRVQGVAFVR